MSPNEIAQILATARLNSTKLSEFPCAPPADLAAAYDIQDALSQYMTSPIAGWKVGVTSEAARQSLNVSEPLAAPLFKDYILPSPVSTQTFDDNQKIVEAEIGFRLNKDLSPRPHAFTRQEIIDAIGSVHPLFEWVNRRLPNGPKLSMEWLIADCGVNDSIICGEGIPFVSDMNTGAETIEMSVNGQITSTGIGTNTMLDPIDAVLWLANHLSARNITLKTNDLIATGSLCDVVTGEAGSTTTAQFGTIGSVSLHFE